MRGAPWYALAAYPVLCAAATAYGRGGFGVDQALTGRYTTIASLAWVAAAGLAAGRLSRHTRPLTRTQTRAVVAGAIVFGYAVVANNLHGWSEWKKSAALLTTARANCSRAIRPCPRTSTRYPPAYGC